MVGLTDLPLELFDRIASHCARPRDVCNLASTCRTLHDYVSRECFRAFFQSAFPALQLPPVPADIPKSDRFYQDATHALTTLSRNLARRAFIAQDIDDDLQGTKGRRAHVLQGPMDFPLNMALQPNQPNIGFQQTMGFQPAIDSYESWYGGAWRSRFQIVAWGAGPRLVVCLSDLRAVTSSGYAGSESTWAHYYERTCVAGRDDILSVHLLPSSKLTSPDVVIARASGNLERISADLRSGKCKRKALHCVDGLTARQTSRNDNGLLAAAKGKELIALFDTNCASEQVLPCSEYRIPCSHEKTRISSMLFLNRKRLAVGLSSKGVPTTDQDITICELDGEGIHSTRPCGNRITEATASSATYSLAKLSGSSIAGRSDGDLFLSGAFNGKIRLHDLRGPVPIVAHFDDCVDYSAIYALSTFGREQFVAGGSRDSVLKFFDIRMPGSRRLYSTNFQTLDRLAAKEANRAKRDKHTDTKRPQTAGWNCFIGRHSGKQAQTSSRTRRNPSINSSVYALSRPSDYSPTLFVGLEGRIIEVDFVSIMDKHPDPVFHTKNANSALSVQEKWDPNEKALRIPMYEHPGRTGAINLRSQKAVGECSSLISCLDERWEDTPPSARGGAPSGLDSAQRRLVNRGRYR